MLKRYTRRQKIAQGRSFSTTGHWTLASETKRGIAIVILFTVAFLTLLSFFQATGTAGVYLLKFLGLAFGWGDWLFPIVLLLLSYLLLRPAQHDIKLVNYIGLLLTVAGYSGLLHLLVRDQDISDIVAAGSGGGYVGYAVGTALYRGFEFWGALSILVAMLCIGLFIFLNTSFSSLLMAIQRLLFHLRAALPERRPKSAEAPPVYNAHFKTSELSDESDEETALEAGLAEDTEPGSRSSSATGRPVGVFQQRSKRLPQPKIDIPIDLLTANAAVPTSGDINATMRKIETTLKNFGIEVTMGEVNVGPTVTQYTLKPTEGVKLNQITALQNDLALALAAHPIRIEAPIPGKSLVGIEVPNQTASIVKLKEILQSQVYTNRRTNLMVALGKDVSGKVMMADLGKMPHLLIAGATGSGKSVCINSMLISLLYQNSPDLLKIILVDPKRVELTSYDSVPHLLAPVIIDIEKTINALRWTVQQMDERYKLLSASGKKNIEAFNEARLVEKLPYIVIIIDELADLMMVAAKEVESAIIRLAQMARAVGIHLVLATQRPSVNVITGLIKANITSRIAFAVASSTDSRTILDSSGAEKLLGNGDMLYISAELTKPKRIQGAFISDTEITAVTDYLKKHGEPEYEMAVTERRQSHTGVSGGFESDTEERDVIAAAESVIRAGRASATLLQSRLRMGFAKASRMLDILEERGIIGPQNSSKPREVLMTKEEFDRTFIESESSEPSHDDAASEINAHNEVPDASSEDEEDEDPNLT
ncbi:MAG: DNA translocase FtsK 4TM domain-containing protein [Candidatus Komeilibacteria bacterium]|nr:DNA translocase FtsK 4TM domain-containing protein [Candidatus Komeilibacteria bacterium]